jgi:hypothetical protein
MVFVCLKCSTSYPHLAPLCQKWGKVGAKSGGCVTSQCSKKNTTVAQIESTGVCGVWSDGDGDACVKGAARLRRRRGLESADRCRRSGDNTFLMLLLFTHQLTAAVARSTRQVWIIAGHVHTSCYTYHQQTTTPRSIPGESKCINGVVP